MVPDDGESDGVWGSTGFDDPEFVHPRLDLDLASFDRSSVEEQATIVTAPHLRREHADLRSGRQDGTVLGMDDRRGPRWSGPTHGDGGIDLPCGPGSR